MQITTLTELQHAKELVSEMKSNATNAFVISVYDEMLDELNRGDVENICMPSYLSILRFGYNIFGILPRVGSR